jgi:UDP-GlcNAc:undecaprenyl-phosphate GlcNAc-1-phosphate transferase
MSIVFHVLLIRFSKSFGLVDVPNKRSIHKNVTPRGAGIAIFMSIILSQVLFNLDHLYTYYLVYLAITVVFIIGLIDDALDITPRLKFFFIIIAAALLYWQGIHINNLGNYLGYNVTLPLFIAFPFTLFAIAGYTNALNLIDGLDGLAGSVSLIILSTFLAVGYKFEDTLMITLSSSFIVALIIFLFFNWHPAKIFMGDSGSLILGLTIAILSILSIKYISPTSVLFIIVLPILDTFIVITRRIQRGVSPFIADKNHMHHFILNVKANTPFSVVVLAAIQLSFSIIGFQLQHSDATLSLILLIVLFFIFFNLFDQRLKRRTKFKNRSN